MKNQIECHDTVRWNTPPNAWTYLVISTPDKDGNVWITNGTGERQTNVKELELVRKYK